MKRIALIGSGNIALQIIGAIEDHTIPNAEVVAVMSHSIQKATEAVSQVSDKSIVIVDTIDNLLKEKPDIIVEAAHPKAVQEYASVIIQSGVDFMPMSVGGLVTPGLLEEIESQAEISGSDLITPAGAVTGLNVASSATALSKDDLFEVCIASTKNPAGLKKAPFFADHPERDISTIDHRQIVFEGNVFDAIKEFPQNVNVAAALALCGTGAEKTKVRVLADPDADKTQHEVYLRGTFGETSCKLKLEVAPNKRSSYLAALGGIATLKKYCSHIKFDY